MKNEMTPNIETVISGLTGTILHAVEGVTHRSKVVALTFSVVGIVEQRGDKRYYHAVEFRGHEITGGYSTADKHWYMGERYRCEELWGEYFSEVFWIDGQSTKEQRNECTVDNAAGSVV